MNNSCRCHGMLHGLWLGLVLLWFGVGFAQGSATIQLTSPNGGEAWVAGSTHNITWQSSGVSGSVDIALWKSGALYRWIAINVPVGSSGTGNYSWTIPMNYPVDGDYIVRIFSVTTPSIADVSNSNFSITPGLQVVSPNGGESWSAGSKHTIQWQSDGLTGNVHLALWKGGVLYRWIATNIPGSPGSFNWTIPMSYSVASDYTVRVINATTSTITDTSNGSFSITPGLQVVVPNGGENWAAGSMHTIQWQNDGVAGNVHLALWKGGALYRWIATNIPVGVGSSGSYSWTIPTSYPIEGDYTVRVISASKSTVMDASNANFTITPGLQVMAPNGGENWAAGSTHTIQWQSDGVTGNVHLALWKGGALYRWIATNIPVGSGAGGSYIWTIPAAYPVEGDYTVRVLSATTSTIADLSNGNFSIVGATAPPAITSVPPTAADEGAVYTYKLAATDPQGGSVQFALSNGPGSISGNTLSWTPTHAQSRVANQFKVTATDTKGLSSTQSWSVTPLGTIEGKEVLTYVDAAGKTTIAPPWDLSSDSIAAMVPDGKSSTGYTVLPGTGRTDGTFVIPHVPAGPYWLQFGLSYYWDKKSDWDFEDYAAGRPDKLDGTNTYLDIKMSGLPNSLSEICFDYWVPNTNDWNGSACPNINFPISGGSFESLLPLFYLADASKGDEAYITVGTADPNYTSPKSLMTMSYVYGPQPLTTPPGATPSLTGTVAIPNTTSTVVSVQRSQFASLADLANPNPFSRGQYFTVSEALYGDQYGGLFDGPYLLHYRDWSAETTDFNLGSVTFGEYDSSEPLSYSVLYHTTRQYDLGGGATWIDSSGVGIDSSTPFTGSSPAKPIIGPVTSPKIDGNPFFADGTLQTGSVISWSAPTIGTPTSYSVVIRKYLGCVTCWQTWSFDTTQTQVRIPAPLAAGTYNVDIFALRTNGPLDDGFAISVSGLRTVPASASASQAAANSSPSTPGSGPLRLNPQVRSILADFGVRLDREGKAIVAPARRR